MAFKAQYMILADNLQPIQSGKLNIHGAFDSIHPPSLPFILPHFVVIALITGEHDDDLGEHEMSVRVEAPGRGMLAEVNGHTKFEAQGNSPWLTVQRMAIQINGMPIKTYGRHRVVIFIDGKEVAEHGILVTERPAPPQPTQG